MRRKLDLNPVAERWLAAIGQLLVAVPLALWLAQRLLGTRPALQVALVASLVSGGALLLAFVVLMAAEQVQDARYDRWYRRQRARRLAAGEGRYECQR